MGTGSICSSGSSRSVLAAIISFNGGTSTIDLIQRLHGMVDFIYVVDNGSLVYSKDLLREKMIENDVDILFLDDNYGIGKALNLARDYAERKSFKWMITFDQDSMPFQSMVGNMLNFSSLNADSVCLAPQRVSRTYNKGPRSGKESVNYAITSGNMVLVELYSKVGGYNESYFVDCLDFEFSLRIRRSGYRIHEVPGALMTHDVGDSSKKLTIINKFYTKHSPVRRYYQFRNIILLLKEYGFYSPIFCLKLFLGQIIQFFFLIALEANRMENIRCIFRGLRDGLRGRSGRYEY